MQGPSGMDPRELMLTAARAAAVYVLMLIVIRALGKRTVGNFSAFDLLVALMLGEVVDEIIYGDVLFMPGRGCRSSRSRCSPYADSWLAYFDHGMEAVLEGKPTIVVRNGRFERPGMRRERMTEKDVMAHLRQRGHPRHARSAPGDRRAGRQRQHPEASWAEPAQKADVVEDEAARARQSWAPRTRRALADRFAPGPGPRHDGSAAHRRARCLCVRDAAG